MSESNCQLKMANPGGFESAGTVARIRRNGKSMRSGRLGLVEHADLDLCELLPWRPRTESRGASERS